MVKLHCKSKAAIAQASHNNMMMMMMLPFMAAASCTMPCNTPNGKFDVQTKVKKNHMKKKDDESYAPVVAAEPEPVIAAEPVIAESSSTSPLRFSMDTARVENERMFHRISHLLLANFALFASFVRLVSGEL